MIIFELYFDYILFVVLVNLNYILTIFCLLY